MEDNKNILGNDSTITIQDEDGKMTECTILFTYENEENNQNYVVFTPIDALDESNDEEEDTPLYAYRYVVNEDGQGELFAIEDDDEYDMINEVIEQFFEDQQSEEE